MKKPRLNYLRLISLVIFALCSFTISAQVEICDDNIDNDGDGAIDEFDFDCTCVNPNLAYYGSTSGDIYTVDLLTNGSEQLITNSPFTSGNINSMASNSDNVLVYYGSGTTVYYWDPTLGTGASSHQVLADLSTFTGFNGTGLESSGASYLNNVYYLAAEVSPGGGDIDDVYAVQLSADGTSVISVTGLGVVAAALADDPSYTSAGLGGFGDIIAIVENGDVVIYGTTGDTFWKFNTTTSNFIMINPLAPNNPPFQLFSNTAGQVFGAFQGGGQIFEVDTTSGGSLGNTHAVPQFITDGTGPLNCPPPEEICGNGQDDDGDGLVDLADPDCCITGTLDSDGDGLIDCADNCPLDPDKFEPGICGCGNPEPGTTCDDGNPDTSLDEIQPDCSCAGYTFDLALTKSGATGNLTPGGNVTFNLTLINQGNIEATGINISDHIPTGLTLNDPAWSESGGIATLNSPISLAAGQSTIITITFNIDSNYQGNSINNIAEISSATNSLGLSDLDSTPDSNPSNDIFGGNDITDNTNNDEDDHDEELTTITQTFDLALIKYGASGSFVPGGIVTYVIDVINQGTLDATDIQITDYIPTGVTLIDPLWTQAGNQATLLFPIGSLPAGQTTSLTITFSINSNYQGGNINNIAEILSANNALGQPDVDSVYDNNSSNDTFGGNDITDNSNGDSDDHDEELTPITQIFDLALIKNGATGNFVPGGSVTYNLVVFNQGTIDATNIVLSDYIPSGLILNDPNWSESGGVATLNTPISLLAPSQSTTVTITFDIDPTFTGNSVSNSAEIASATNALGLTDSDSTFDAINGNDIFGGNDITNNFNNDEDDHDEEVTDICQDTINCPADINVNNDPGLCSAIVNFSPPLDPVNCLGYTVTQTAGLPSGSAFPVGATLITYTLTPTVGDVVICNFFINVADTEDPSISCPTDITVNNDPGDCGAIVTYSPPVGTDNCSGSTTTLISGGASGSFFNVGTSIVVYEVVDASGNSAQCSFNVTVIDNEPPQIVCPLDITMSNDPGACGAIVSYIPPVGTDNCAGASTVLTNGLASGSFFPVGTTTITFTVTDAVGLTADCSFNIIVNDTEDPTIICPADIIVSNDLNQCSAIVTYTVPVGQDNCSGSITNLTTGLSSGSPFPLGTTLVTYEVTDAAGNSTSCSFNVTVNDTEDPTITCPADITVSNDAGNCSALVNFIPPVGTDNCPGATTLLTNGLPPGSIFPVGTTTETYTVTDAAGNTATCSFTITVLDNENPVITCPSDITVNNDPGQCSAVVTYVAPTEIDNCPGASTAQTAGLGSGGTFPVGTTTDTYTVTDAAGNTATCSFTITVLDNENPLINCPSDITVNNDPGQCSAVVTYTAPTGTDNCPGASTAQTAGLGSGGTFPVGTTTETYTVSDAAGNTATCSFTITVIDNENPVITCPSDITVNNDLGICGAIVTYIPPIGTDNCPGASTIQSSGLGTGSFFPVGTTTESFIVTDAFGNTSTCSFNITVIDNEAPVLSDTPSDLTVQCEDEIPGNPGISATDNCNCAGPVIFTQLGLPLTCPGSGTVTNTWSSTDCNGNTTSYTQTITIQDTLPPTLSDMPGNITVNCQTEALGDPGITANDNCEGVVPVTYTETGPGSACPGSGIVTKTWTASDCNGNSISHTQIITINDTLPPVLSAEPVDLTVSCVDEAPGDPGITANDNCLEVVTVIFTQTGPGPEDCQGTGTVLNTWTVSDCSGNTATHTQTITILDQLSPVLSFLPGDTTVTCESLVPANNSITASDNCDGIVDVTFSQSGLPLPCPGLGTVTNNWTAQDCAGNITTHTQTVTILDTLPPVFSFEPPDITVQCATEVPGNPGIVATDACQGFIPVIFEQFPSLDPCPGTGSVLNKWTATDCAGNTVTHEQLVTINDSTAPLLSSMPGDLIVECDVDVPGDPGISAFDNCQGPVSVTFVQNGLPLTCPGTGIVTNTWTAQDCNNNVVQHVQTITIQDTSPPALSTNPIDLTVLCAQDVPGDPGITANDNCDGVVSVTFSKDTVEYNNCIGNGIIKNIWSASDCSGNETIYTQTITINDTIPPQLSSLPGDLTVACETNVPGDPGISATDNCGELISVTYAQVGSPLNCEGSGLIQNIWTATDCNGNTTIHTQNVTVNDTVPPLLSLNPDDFQALTVLCEVDIPGNPGITATDNCDDDVTVEFEQIGLPLECPGIGVVQNVWTATDCAGNTTSFTQVITVDDTIDPGITFLPPDTTVNCVSNIPGDPGLTGFDLCGGEVTITFSQSPLPTECLGTGSITNTWVATDCAGNSFTYNQLVTVNDTIPPILVPLPGDTTVNCVNEIPGLQGVTATDNCEGPIDVNYSQSAFTSTNPGSGSVINTWSATDCNGNSATHTQIVTVNDTIDPVCSSQDITIYLDSSGNISVSASDIDNNSSDNCSDISLSISQSTFDCTSIGTNNVLLTVTDQNGNDSSCPAIITVLDSISPTCSTNNLTIELDSNGSASITAEEVNNGSSDACGISTISVSPNSFTCANVGENTVTFSVTDVNGNTSTCESTITVLDNENPNIICPADIVVNNDLGICGALVNYVPPIGTDNCPGAITALISGQGTGTTFPVGTSTEVYEVTDASGNKASCSFTITVIDNENPVIVCPSDITVNNDPGLCSAVVAYTAPIGTDNCPGAITVQTSGLGTGSTFPVGTTTETFMVTDAAGNTATCSFTVTVLDNENPTITCPSNITVNNDPGLCSAVVSYLAPVGLDNCPGALTSLTSGLGSGSSFPIGVTTETYTVTDAAGNTASCSFTITVIDNENPLISCPANITVNNDPGLCSAIVNYTAPTGTDNCPGSITALTGGLGSGSAFPVGITTEIYTVTDAAGNTATCSFTITVIDNEDPVIVCPLDIVVNNDSGLCNAVVSWDEPTSSDNCPGSIVSSTHNSGDTFEVGITNVIYTIIDASGNEVNCDFDITVIDNEAPIILCPGGVIQNNDPGQCGALVTWDSPISSDNCPNFVVTCSHNSGDFFPVGTTTVTYTATDSSGNTAQCDFDVVIMDDENPTITCPNNIVVDADSAQCGAIVEYIPPIGADNCPGAVTTQDGANVLTSGDFFPVGTTTLFYSVTDASGNIASCSFTITVIDNEPPTIECPIDIVVNTDIDECSALVIYNPPIGIDNCPGAITDQTDLTGLSTGSAFPIGTTTLEYTVTDAAGNFATCTFNITVLDDQSPSILCPDNIEVNNDPGVCGAIVNYVAPTGTDNCPGAITVQSDITGLTNGSFFPVGTTTLEYTVTDASGNSASCSFTITVVDSELPTITCPPDITVNNDPGLCGAVVNFVAPVGSDNCPNSTTTQIAGLSSGSLFPVGITTQTFMVTDASGNSAQCSFTVQVIDNENPTIVCPADTTLFTVNNSCVTFAAWEFWEYPLYNDNCPGATLSSDHPQELFELGTTTVTYTVTDAVGLTAVCSFDVTVVDAQPPTIECPSDTVVYTDPGICEKQVFWEDPVVSDNCPDFTVTCSHTSGDIFPVGVTTVTCTVTDISGNSMTCSFDITVLDNEPPIIDCPLDIVMENDSAQCGAIVTWPDPVISDNCGSYLVDVTHSSGDFFPVGTTTVTYTITDSADLISTCSFDITVNDTEDPILVCPDDIIVSNDIGECSASISWDIPVATDNCEGLVLVGSHEPGEACSVGITTVTYTATDASGNSVSCEFTITVLDSEPPSIICPSDIFVDNDPFQCGAMVAFDIPVGTDNCPGAITTQTDLTGLQSGFIFPIGTTTLEYTVIDAGGLSNTCSFDITVTDNETPTCFVQNIDLTVNPDGTASITPADIDAGSSDNCAIASLELDQTDFTCYQAGINEVILTVTDIYGNSSSCPANVNVIGENEVDLTCLTQDITVNLDPDGSVSVSPVQLDISNNCGDPQFFLDKTEFDCSDIGQNTVTLTIANDAGAVSCQAQVTIVDPSVPECTATGATVSLDENGMATINPSDILDLSFSICGGETIDLDKASFDCSDLGLNSVSVTITGVDGTQVSCTSIVNVIDDSAPICDIDDVVVYLDDNGLGSVNLPTLNTNTVDNCGIVLYSMANNSFDCNNIGPANAVFITASDLNGNSVDCPANVVVLDSISPTCTGQNNSYNLTSANPIINLDAVDLVLTSNDNCGDVSFILDPSQLDCSNLGLNTVEITVIDNSGNTGTCLSEVSISDNENPNCVFENNTVYLEPGGFLLLDGSEVGQLSTDNCSIVDYSLDDFFFECVDLGPNTLTLTVTDQSGNSSSCSGEIIVADTLPSGGTCKNLIASLNNFEVTVPLSALFNSTNCELEVDLFVDGSPNDLLFTCEDVGENIVELEIVNSIGESSTCISIVTVQDNNEPTFVGACQDASLDVGDCDGGFVSVITPLVSDDCLESLINDYNGTSDASDYYPIGTHIVNWTATDVGNNQVSCQVTITVTGNGGDTEDPIISGPSNIVSDFGGINGNCGTYVSVPIPTATDNCALDASSWTMSSPYADANADPRDASGTYPVGTTNVSWTVSDFSGNTTVYSITVKVNKISAAQNLGVACSANGNKVEFTWDAVPHTAGYRILVRHVPGTGTPALQKVSTQLNPNFVFKDYNQTLFVPGGQYRFKIYTGCLKFPNLNPNQISNYSVSQTDWYEFTNPCLSPIIVDDVVIEEPEIKALSASDIEVLVYPNPADDILFIESNKTIQKITVRDVLGKVYMEKRGLGEQRILDLSRLESNIYLVQLEIDGQILIERIIVH